MSTHQRTEPFFFAAQDGTQLFGVWRASATAVHTAWIICPPFAEEEKSAHRTLVELCDRLRERGDASLFFAYRGTADSALDFSQATLTAWRDDIRAAYGETKRRAPDAQIGLIGLRLGASLAAQMVNEVGASRLVLIEPILNGRTYIGAMSQRKKLRAMMTQDAVAQSDLSQNAVVDKNASPVTENAPPALTNNDVEDFDGWPISQTLRNELSALNLMPPPELENIRTLVVQVAPREAIATPLVRFAEGCKAKTRAVVMKPFWNLIDYTRADSLFETILDFEFQP